MNRPVILSCGEVLWDLFPEGACFGGAPANFACHAAILGGKVALLSAVGGDARGGEALAILRNLGVETSLIQRRADAPTGTVGVSVDGAGQPAFEIHPDSAWDGIVWTPALAGRVASADAIYFGTLGQRGATSRATIRQALGVAGARGIPRVLDVNLRQPFYHAALIRESIAEASILKLSDEELGEVAAACGVAFAGDAEATLRNLLVKENLDLIAMTRGADGALVVTRGETIDQPGIPAQVIDTVGAGDSFTAALTVGLLQGGPVRTIARTACETASAVCAQPGAVPLPLASAKS